MVLTKNRAFHSRKGRFFIFSMIWYNHTFGQICLLKRTFSQMIDVVPGPFVSKFHEILMQFVEYFSLSDSKLNSLSPIVYNTRPSHPTRPGILYRLPYLSSLHTPTLSFKQQRKLQTTPPNNVNSK